MQQQPAKAARPSRRRLLVVDDNKVNRLLLARSLDLHLPDAAGPRMPYAPLTERLAECARGVAVIRPGLPRAELRRLHDGGWS